MKFIKTSLLFLCMTFLVIGASAQGKPPFAKKQGLSRQTEVMKKDLGLNAEQTKKVEKLNQETMAERANIRREAVNSTPKNSNGISASAKNKAKGKQKNLKKTYRQELKAILTPQQFAEWNKGNTPKKNK